MYVYTIFRILAFIGRRYLSVTAYPSAHLLEFFFQTVSLNVSFKERMGVHSTFHWLQFHFYSRPRHSTKSNSDWTFLEPLPFFWVIQECCRATYLLKALSDKYTASWLICLQMFGQKLNVYVYRGLPTFPLHIIMCSLTRLSIINGVFSSQSHRIIPI